MRILCLGISHKTADVSVRERVVFDPPATHRALAELRRRWGGGEFLVLSTCNRTEVYVARPVHGHPREQELSDWLGEFHGVHHSVYAGSVYLLSDERAISHLFAVAAGLESLVPGEDQIVGQIKQAYEAAQAAHTAGPVVNELVQKSLHVAKHVRSETGIAQGKVSVASVAIDCVLRTFQSLGDKTVLSIGAGKMNDLMLRHLADKHPQKLLVVNRSIVKARALALGCGGEAVRFASLPEHLAQADVVLSSTASPRPILTAAMIREAQRHRHGRPMLIIDLAVPRDVEGEAAQVRGVRLHNIDSLDQIVQATLASRLSDQAAGRTVIEEHVAECMKSLNLRAVAPTIDAFYRLLNTIAEEELQAALRKLRTHADLEADEAVLRQVLHRTVRRILHPAAHNLRHAAGTDAARAHVSAIRTLFGLQE